MLTEGQNLLDSVVSIEEKLEQRFKLEGAHSTKQNTLLTYFFQKMRGSVARLIRRSAMPKIDDGGAEKIKS